MKINLFCSRRVGARAGIRIKQGSRKMVMFQQMWCSQSMALRGRGSWNSHLSACRWFSQTEDIPPIFIRKSKTSCSPFTLFFPHGSRKPGEKKDPPCSSSCDRQCFVSPKPGFPFLEESCNESSTVAEFKNFVFKVVLKFVAVVLHLEALQMERGPRY